MREPSFWAPWSVGAVIAIIVLVVAIVAAFVPTSVEPFKLLVMVAALALARLL